jgi:hypothetical protein
MECDNKVCDKATECWKKEERAKKIKHTVYPSGMDSHGIQGHSAKSVERTRKDLDTNVMYHNAKRKHGMDINDKVYQVPLSKAYLRNYDNIKWDK